MSENEQDMGTNAVEGIVPVVESIVHKNDAVEDATVAPGTVVPHALTYVDTRPPLEYVDHTQENYPEEVVDTNAPSTDFADIVSTLDSEDVDDYCAVEVVETIPTEEPEYMGEWETAQEDLPEPIVASSSCCQVKDIFSVDDSVFCYVETYADKFNVVRLPYEDKREIRRVIGEPSFVCVLPSYVYNETILGYTEEVAAGRAYYTVYSVNELWSFSVPEEFGKNLGHINMRAYLNTVVNECPLSDLQKTAYPSTRNFVSYSIPSYGIFEMRDKNDEVYFFQLKKEYLDFSFFSVALYMRNILDHADLVTVNCLSALFDRII